jgi:hypothetical protein
VRGAREEQRRGGGGEREKTFDMWAPPGGEGWEIGLVRWS